MRPPLLPVVLAGLVATTVAAATSTEAFFRPAPDLARKYDAGEVFPKGRIFPAGFYGLNLGRDKPDGLTLIGPYGREQNIEAAKEHGLKCTYTISLPMEFHSTEPHEPTLAGVLRDAGYTTMMIADTAAIFKNNYHRDFDWYHWNRGQEHDPIWSGNRHDDVWKYLKPDHHDIPAERKQRGEGAIDSLTQYLRNTARWQSEEDYFAAKSWRLAMDWLDDNADCQPFFLWLDLFDPHEPWDPPEHYRRLYDSPDYDGPKLITPWFHSLLYEDFAEEEQRHFEALYAGEVTFVDHWVGQLLRKVELMGLLEDTMIVFTSDHGTNLGERGHVTKCPKAGNTLCRGLARVPLVMHHPGGPHGARVEQLSWSPDITPTVLSQMGMDVPDDMHGHDLWAVTRGDASAGRDFTITGWGGQKWYGCNRQTSP